MKYKSIYVAATSQHVGKTTCTLGVASVLSKQGINVGYCKPVGQKYVPYRDIFIDKDVVLFSDLLAFDPVQALHSPVILGAGATTNFLDTPSSFHYPKNILKAAALLEQKHDLVIYEGTGHPGVGSVVDLSNAEVARLLGAGVIMIAEGGIGSTIDELNLCINMFRAQNVPIIGVILNKVIPSKIEKVRKYVSLWLSKMDIPLLGILTFDKTMGNPTLATISESVNGKVILNQHKLNNKVEGIIAGSLITAEEFDEKGANLLLVVGASRLDWAIADTIEIMKSKQISSSPFSGIIATGLGTQNETTLAYITKHEIPLIHTMLETHGAVVKIDRIEVKINPQTPWKITKAIRMIEKNIDMNDLLIAK